MQVIKTVQALGKPSCLREEEKKKNYEHFSTLTHVPVSCIPQD